MYDEHLKGKVRASDRILVLNFLQALRYAKDSGKGMGKGVGAETSFWEQRAKSSVSNQPSC